MEPQSTYFEVASFDGILKLLWPTAFHWNSNWYFCRSCIWCHFEAAVADCISLEPQSSFFVGTGFDSILKLLWPTAFHWDRGRYFVYELDLMVFWSCSGGLHCIGAAVNIFCTSWIWWHFEAAVADCILLDLQPIYFGGAVVDGNLLSQLSTFTCFRGQYF